MKFTLPEGHGGGELVWYGQSKTAKTSAAINSPLKNQLAINVIYL